MVQEIMKYCKSQNSLKKKIGISCFEIRAMNAVLKKVRSLITIQYHENISQERRCN